MAFRVRSLQRGELDGFLLCFQEAFGVEDSSISIVRNSLVNDPYFHPDRVRVGVLDGEIVSHVVVLHRGVYVGSRIVTVAGVTAVATHPARQGRGYGTRVMQDTIRMIRQQGYDLAMLTSRVPGFFTRLGFREVPKMDGYACPVSALARPSVTDAYVVEKLDYNSHWPAIAAVYDKYSEARTGLQVRDLRFWETWPRRGTFPYGFSSQLDALGLVALLGGNLVAYLAAHIPLEQPHVTISELGHLRGHEQAALVLLQAAAQHFLSVGPSRAVLHVGGNAPIIPLLEAQHVPLQAEVGPGLMVLITSKGWLHEAGFRSADEAVEVLFRSPPPILWQRDGY